MYIRNFCVREEEGEGACCLTASELVDTLEPIVSSVVNAVRRDSTL